MRLVSVVIPAYNASQYIKEAVDSVLAQTYNAIQIIVVDDGSQDGTKNVLEDYILNDTIKYYYQDNQGPGAARNYGIKKSTGEYICFLDSDDIILPESIEKKVNLLDRNKDIQMVFTDLYAFDASSEENPEAYLKSHDFIQLFCDAVVFQDDPYYFFNKKYIDSAIKYNPFIQTSTVMIKKDVIDRVGFFDTELKAAEDIDLWFRICQVGEIGFINEPLSRWNKYRNGLTKDVFGFLRDSIKYYESLLLKTNLNSVSITLLKKKISQFYFDLGYSYFERGDLNNSRQYFVKSIINYFPHLPINFKCLLLSYIPEKIFKKIKKID